jgi:hypothetical protein
MLDGKSVRSRARVVVQQINNIYYIVIITKNNVRFRSGRPSLADSNSHGATAILLSKNLCQKKTYSKSCLKNQTLSLLADADSRRRASRQAADAEKELIYVRATCHTLQPSLGRETNERRAPLGRKRRRRDTGWKWRLIPWIHSSYYMLNKRRRERMTTLSRLTDQTPH